MKVLCGCALDVSTGYRESVIISQVNHTIHEVSITHQISEPGDVFQIFRIFSNLSDQFKPLLLEQLQNLRAASCALGECWSRWSQLCKVVK